MCEDLAVELEALQFTYNDQLEADAEGAHLLLKLVPRGTEEEFERYARATLRLGLPPGYPAELPSVELVDAKGLSDGQLTACQQAVLHEAESLRGEMMLGHLCETAIDSLTAANRPSGDCAFCLEPVAAGEGIVAGHQSPAYDVLKLGCYHCFHLPCFAPWWHWQQRQLAQRESQLQGEYKAMAGAKLREEHIEKDVEGVYIVRCPTCRAPVPFASLAHVADALNSASTESWTQQQQQTSLGCTKPLLVALGQEALQRLQQQRRRNAAALAKQQQAGGLIDHDKGVAVSLADLQLAAEASRAAAAAAETAAAATDAAVVGAAAAAAAAASSSSSPMQPAVQGGTAARLQGGRGVENGGSGGSRRDRGRGQERQRGLHPRASHPQPKEGQHHEPQHEGAQQLLRQHGQQQQQGLLPRHEGSAAHTGRTNGPKQGQQQSQQRAQRASKSGMGTGQRGPRLSQPGGVSPPDPVACSGSHSDRAAASASTLPNGAPSPPRGVGSAGASSSGRGSGRGGGRQHSRSHHGSGGGGGGRGPGGQLPRYKEDLSDKGGSWPHREAGVGRGMGTVLLHQPQG